MLTTIQGAIALEDGYGEVRRIDGRQVTAFTTKPSLLSSTPPVSHKAPISVIEVRVSGVTGPNASSLARINLAAERIAKQTGLTVNVTAGSSPYDQAVHLAAGHFGQPAMNVTQGWVRLGVDSLIIQGLSSEDQVLAVLVLVAAVLFAGSATAVAVQGRRREIATLRTVGWARGDVARLVVGECVAIGAVAGVVGLGVLVVAVAASGLVIPATRFALVVPAAIVVAALGAGLPAWHSGVAAPIEPLRGPALALGRRRSVSSPGALAAANVSRLRGRSLVAVTNLALAVLVLSVVVGVVVAFGGGVAHSLLGNAVAFQVRGAELVSAGLVVAIGAVAVADVQVAELRDRAAELALLAAVGWTPGQIARLALRESALLAAAGALLGALAGLGILLGLGGQIGSSLVSVALAAAIGAALAMVGVLLPLRRQARLQPAGALSGE